MPTIEEPSVHEEDNFQFSYHWILDFLSQPQQEGYIFARADDQRFIPGINADLVKDLGGKGIKAATIFLRTDTDEPIVYQIEKAGETLQALIVANLHEIIKETEEGFSLLTQLNFGRERLWDLHIPILFWADERSMYLIANEAPDLHSQRRLSTVHFTGKMDVTVAGMLPDREGWDAFLSSEESAALEANINILKRRLDGAKQGGYSELRTLAEIVVPLAKDYARMGLGDEVETLINEYKAIIERTDDAGLLKEIAIVYETMHHFEQSIFYREKALEAAENLFGADNIQVAEFVNDVAVALLNAGEFEASELLMERAVKIEEKTYGEEHPNVIPRLNNLVAARISTGKSIEAESLARKALKMAEHTYGLEHSVVAKCLNTLGVLLRDIGNLNGAAHIMEQVVKIEEKNLGPEHPQLAVYLSNLGTIFQEIGQSNDAQLLTERALKIGERAYGPDHPIVAKRLNNLGLLLREIGKLKEAEPLLFRALVINLKALGLTHPDTQAANHNYINILQSTGKTEQQIKQIIRSLQSSITTQ